MWTEWVTEKITGRRGPDPYDPGWEFSPAIEVDECLFTTLTEEVSIFER